MREEWGTAPPSSFDRSTMSLLSRLQIISGGQSGVDTVALEVASHFGVRTGGTAPHGWYRYDDSGRLTSDRAFFQKYGLTEGPPDPKRWVKRTHLNAADSHFTVWFGNISPGYWCTSNGCIRAQRRFLPNIFAHEIATHFLTVLPLLLPDDHVVMNVAGNRRHTNPDASDLCLSTLQQFLGDLQKLDT